MHVVLVAASFLLLSVSAFAATALPSADALKRAAEIVTKTLTFDQKMQVRQSNTALVAEPERERTSGRLSSVSAEGNLTVEIDGTDITFSDVPLSAWFAPYVREAVEKNVLSGYKDASGNPTGIYGPERPVSVAELIKIAVLAGGGNPDACGEPQNPKAKGQWFSGPFACAERSEWVLVADGTVDPARQALRGEVIVTMLQAFSVELQPLGETGPFTDVTASTQFAAAIARAKKDGIVRGYTDAQGNLTGFLGPTDRVTRAEAAKILMLSMHEYH